LEVAGEDGETDLLLHVQDGLVRHLSLVLGIDAGLAAQCDRAEEEGPLARVSE
jgi:hypothetical protein